MAKTAKYNVIAKDAKTGAERILGEIRAAGQIEAKKAAVRQYFTQINMIAEHLLVVRA